jgi:hypothetical protein
MYFRDGRINPNLTDVQRAVAANQPLIDSSGHRPGFAFVNDAATREARGPAGVMEHLVSAEVHARGLDRFTRDTPSLLTSVCLFDWDSGRQMWPPPQPSISAAFAATLVPADNSADWANNYERRAAAQQRERQYIADYYARTTREQEERENREARERFAASQRKKST